MNRFFIVGLTCLGIAMGMTIGCLFRPVCSEDLSCGPFKNGVYRAAEYDNQELIGDTPTDRVIIDDSTVTVSYGRPNGSQWKVIFRRTGKIEKEEW